MILRIGPVSIGWPSLAEDKASQPPPADWWVRSLGASEAAYRRGPEGIRWFDNGEWSGIETPEWMAWIGNRLKVAATWGGTDGVAVGEARSVVIPAILRREGIVDGHGAVLAPDPKRPDDGVFITGLSGSGKSTLAISAVLGGARLVSDDSVAIGLGPDGWRGWSRRSSMSLSAATHRRLLPNGPGQEVDGKVWFDAKSTFGEQVVESVRVRSVVFLERPSDSRSAPAIATSFAISPADAYRRLLMGHPILAMDRGARKCFKVVRALAELPAYHVVTGTNVLRDPKSVSAALALLLPLGLWTDPR